MIKAVLMRMRIAAGIAAWLLRCPYTRTVAGGASVPSQGSTTLQALPKVELNAHLNGTVRDSTIR